MTPPHLRLGAAAAGVTLVCGLTGLVAAISSAAAPASRPLPPGFRAVSFSALGARHWWITGVIPCRFRHPCLGLVRTSDGGRDYTRVPLPTLVAVDGNQSATAQFADSDDGYLAAVRLWGTHDGGRHWRVLNLGGDVLSVATGGGFVYAVVDTRFPRALLMRSPVGRDDWTVLAASADGFQAVTVEGGTVLLDKSVTLGGEQEILISHDEGASFTASQPLSETSCSALEPTPDVVWALCRGGMMDGLYRSSDAGRTFAQPTGPTLHSQNPSELLPGGATIGAASATIAVIGGQQLLRTTDAGASFKRVPLPTADGGWQVGFVNPRDGLALGRFGENSDPPARLYLTTNAGVSYHRVAIG